jgi:hypothetical protein
MKEIVNDFLVKKEGILAHIRNIQGLRGVLYQPCVLDGVACSIVYDTGKDSIIGIETPFSVEYIPIKEEV